MSVVSRVAILGVGDRRGARLWVLLRKALVDPLALGRQLAILVHQIVHVSQPWRKTRQPAISTDRK